MVRRTSKEVTTLMRIAAAVVTIVSVYFFAPWKFALVLYFPIANIC
ncbi:hypothetical protein [Pseudoalteromonas sp. H105]|nr:hypothetical protein [Pseudoalteromonas sp. H105]